MSEPTKLYRYRPLDDSLLERELSALRDSYLYSPPFSAMNDPMEAFYEIGGPYDGVMHALLPSSKQYADEFYKTFISTIERLALISFAGSPTDLPMWAYYASNFAGFCLEFDTNELGVGDLQGEKLVPVTYSHEPLPPFSVIGMSRDLLLDAIISRVSRKRIEWAHEKEWRFLTGSKGPKHYLDDALRRVYLGPRIKPEHAAKICELLDRRPVEVIQAHVKGYELEFSTVKPVTPLAKCERVGSGYFKYNDDLRPEENIRNFLAVPFDLLVKQCNAIASRPNMQEFFYIDISSNDTSKLCIGTVFKLRNGREIYRKLHYDQYLHPCS